VNHAALTIRVAVFAFLLPPQLAGLGRALHRQVTQIDQAQNHRITQFLSDQREMVVGQIDVASDSAL
jgi:hypothetical protein